MTYDMDFYKLSHKKLEKSYLAITLHNIYLPPLMPITYILDFGSILLAVLFSPEYYISSNLEILNTHFGLKQICFYENY